MRAVPRESAIGNTTDSLKNDKCTKLVSEKQSQDPGSYMLTNYYDFCDVDKKEAQLMLEEPGNFIWNGYSPFGCNIDSDSYLRHNSVQTNPRLLHQLFSRPYLTVPYMARGTGEPDLESFLRTGYQTSERPSCNTLAEISIQPERMVYPMYCCNQEVEHIVPEWVRGGVDTRNDIRRVQYKRRCIGAEHY